MSIHKLSTGKKKWQVKWRQYGVQKSKTFATKIEAESFWARKRVELDEGTLARPQHEMLPFGRIVEEVLVWKKHTIKASSYRNYKRIANKINAHVVSTLPIKNITDRDWLEFLESLNLGGKDIALTKTFISICYNYAAEKNYYNGGNPIKKKTSLAAAYKKSEANIRREIPDVEAVAKIYSHIDIDVYRLLFELLLYSGVRISEAIALTVGDIDFENKTVSITKQFSLTTKTIDTTKTGRSRSVPVPEAWLSQVKKTVDLTAKKEPVFKKNGQRLPYHAFNTYISNLQKKLLKEEERFVNHQLRHLAVSAAINAGCNIKIVQAIAGHTTPSTTLDIYGHLMTQDFGVIGDRIFNEISSFLE